MHPDLLKVQQQLESKFLSQQAEVEAKALQLYEESPVKAVTYLTQYSGEQGQYAFENWKKLGEFLTIKYMDGIVRKEKDGEFIRNEYGNPSAPQRVGYPQKFYKEVVKQTGDRFKVVE